MATAQQLIASPHVHKCGAQLRTADGASVEGLLKQSHQPTASHSMIDQPVSIMHLHRYPGSAATSRHAASRHVGTVGHFLVCFFGSREMEWIAILVLMAFAAISPICSMR